MALHTARIQRDLLNQSVLLTGPPRSGTTLLGKLISSLEGMEYHFEPPLLYMLGAAYANGDLPLHSAAHLLSVYLSEDLLLESVHGRGVNLRPEDDSQVLNRITWSELHDRWQQVSNRNDAIALAQKRGLRLALKMPNLFDSLELMRATMPSMRLVISVRNGIDVVRSIIRKGWVTNAALEYELWPFCGAREGVNIPYWVADEYRERWPAMNEASRACLMWVHHAELGLNAAAESRSRGVVHEVRYEDLLADPWPVVEAMAEVLGANTTLFTRRWVESIRPPHSMSEGGYRDFSTATEPDILERFDRVNSLWGY